MSYWNLSDLQNLISPQVVLEIYDDTRQGYPNPAQLAQVQALSDSMVDGALARVYPGPFPIVQNFNAWVANTAYAVGQMVVPTVPNGFAFRVVGLSGTSGAVQPTWPTVLSQTVTDGTITWVCISLTPELVRMSSLLWAKYFSYEKHPEYFKRYGDLSRKNAQEYMDRLVAARQYLIDALNMSKPDNVGAYVVDNGPRMTLDANGMTNTGDF